MGGFDKILGIERGSFLRFAESLEERRDLFALSATGKGRASLAISRTLKEAALQRLLYDPSILPWVSLGGRGNFLINHKRAVVAS